MKRKNNLATMTKRLTIDDLLPSGRSDKLIIDQVNGKPRILRNGKDIKKQKPELYLNEGELKKAAKEYLEKLKHCRVISTDNMPLIVRGRRTKTREPGMADQHLCIMGKFVALEGKMPGETLKPKQKDYKRDILAAMGIFIEYRSLFELETELLKNKLISRRVL